MERNLFDRLKNKYNNKINPKTQNTVLHEECQHVNISSEGNNCLDCGVIVQSNHKLWKTNLCETYEDSLNTQRVKKKTRSIHQDIKCLNFNDDIVEKVDNMYNAVCNAKSVNKTTKICRGNSRRGLICACFANVFQQENIPHSLSDLCQLFKIKMTTGLQGMQTIIIYLPKTVTYNSFNPAKSLIHDIMNQIEAPTAQIDSVVELYQYLQNKSTKLKRSRLRSVVCGLIFYWIKTTKKKITLKQFHSIVSLSEITIKKIVTEIETTLLRYGRKKLWI